MKIIIFKKSDILIISFFSSTTNTNIIKNYLIHMYVAYSNFFFDSFEIAKNKYSEPIATISKNINNNIQSQNKKKNKDSKLKNNNNNLSNPYIQVLTDGRNNNNNNNLSNPYSQVLTEGRINNNKKNEDNKNKNLSTLENKNNKNKNNNNQIKNQLENQIENQIENRIENQIDDLQYKEKEKSFFLKLLKNIFFEVKILLKTNKN